MGSFFTKNEENIFTILIQWCTTSSASSNEETPLKKTFKSFDQDYAE